MTPDAIAQLFGQGGPLVFLLVAWLKEWIVSGTQHRRTLDEVIFWRNIALQTSGVAERAVDLAERRHNP